MGFNGIGSLVLLTPAMRAMVVDKVIMDASARLTATTKLLMDEKITFRVWLIQMRDILVASLAAAALALTGKGRLDDAEEEAWVSETNLQYGYLVNWYHQMREGRQQFNQAMVARADLYARALWAVAWRVVVAGELARDVPGRRPWGIRSLGRAEHCRSVHSGTEGCVELAEKGWLPLEDVAPIGTATCGSRCHCSISIEWR